MPTVFEGIQTPQIQMSFQVTQMSISAFVHDRALYVPADIQRRFTCPLPHQQAFIDSLLCGVIIPTLTINRVISSGGLYKYEILDGIQRITSILRYIDNQFPTFTVNQAKRIDPGGKIPVEPGCYFRDLTVAAQKVIMQFQLSLLILQNIDEERKGVLFRRMNGNIQKLTTAQKYVSYNSKAVTYARKISAYPFWSESYIGDKEKSQDIQGSLYPLMIEAKNGQYCKLSSGAIREWSLGQHDALVTSVLYSKVEERFLAVGHLFKGVRFKYGIQVIPMYQAALFLERDGIDAFACEEGCLTKWFDGLTKNNYGTYYRGASDIFHKIANIKSQKEFWDDRKNLENMKRVCTSSLIPVLLRA